MVLRNIINLKGGSMWWKTLILFPQTSNPRVKKLYCTCSKDNEAVIKMIIKGRSPTMRHVSRTHRVALDWLFDRINLDPKIQIKYIDTKNQLADILTKGNFTRDEWNHWLCLFNISHFSPTVLLCCNGKKISTRFRRRTNHSKIKTYDEFLLRGRHRSCRLQLHWARWRDITENKILGDLLLQMIDEGNLINSPQQVIQNWVMTVPSSSQEWKSEVTAHDRSGQPDKDFLEYGPTNLSSSWRCSSRRRCAIRKVRRDASWSIRATW